MQTIIMTVGTSLLTNPDKGSPNKRPWLGQKIIGDPQRALGWIKNAELELISAETNTYWRLDPTPQDVLILLHSDTPSGLECAQILKLFFEQELGQQQISLVPLPGINYDLDEQGSSLEQMARMLIKLVEQAEGNITFAATGGFKAQTMIMALVGNQLGIPVCYIHEQYNALIYLPYLAGGTQHQQRVIRANLPDSGRRRSDVIQVQANIAHHRPRSWEKVQKLLQDTPWVDLVRYDSHAYAAPKNAIKSSPRKTSDGRHILWIHLHESEDTHMAVMVETTGHTPAYLEQAAAELRERLGRLL